MQQLKQNLKVLPLVKQYETLNALFASSANQFAKRTALQFENESLTYSELHTLAERFALHLRSRGVQAGDYVVLYMPRGIDMFIGMLGIIQAGAVYVPMDPHAPIDRVTYVYKDCQAKFIVTSSTLMKPDFSVACLYLDELRDTLKDISPLPTANEQKPTGDDIAYVIYTSGSTGQPKGVMIRHSSIAHLIESESSILNIRSDDVVLQGFSLSFDMSLEEIWTTFYAGAKLVIASHEMMTSGPDLAPQLSQLGITVWHCVPTLLAMQQDEIPSLRLLNLGGEACPANLVNRWARNNRRLLNTYGPTETTVTATYAELIANKPITIGKTLPGYTSYVVDENLQPVPDGNEGELCIGGPGLAAGYLNRPDLTAEKFVKAPFQNEDGSDIFFYRTGDLVRLNSELDIEFLGRFDTQIKIRGFRVELSEIESVLMQVKGVQNAIVALLKDKQGFDALVAFVIVSEDKSFQEALAWQHMRSKLPPYMIPTLLEVVPDLERLPSGKINRKVLKFPEKASVSQKALKLPTTEMEKKIHTVWSELFAPVPVSIEDDFFLDLGGHSLRAALMISKLRKEQNLSSISIQAVYKFRNISTLAAHLSEKESEYEGKETTKFQTVSKKRYAACVSAQALSLSLICCLIALEWLLPYGEFAYEIQTHHTIFVSLFVSLMVGLTISPLMFLVSILTKKLVIGTFKEGDYPVWGSYYFRWWFVKRIHALVPTAMFRGTPLLNAYYRCMGAKIGKNVFLNTESCDAWDLLSIGEGSTVSTGVVFSCSSVEGGLLKLRKISIGECCYIGDSSVLGMSTQMDNASHLEELSFLSNKRIVPSKEVWTGSPARHIANVQHVPAKDANRIPFLLACTQIILAFLIPLFLFVPMIPGLVFLLDFKDSFTVWNYLACAPLLALSYIVCTCLFIAAAKWLLLGKVKEQKISIGSFHYLRFWIMNHLMDISLSTIRPIYATLYLAPWFRLLGVKLGKRAEVSTASGVTWDLLTIEDESFVADGVILGVPKIANGYVELRSTKIGKRTFLGNSAFVPGGTHLSDNMLIGCLSVPPRQEEQRLQSCASWFGSPALYLPQRQMFNEFNEETTFYPSRKLYALRLFIEGVRILLPMTLGIVFGSMVIACFLKLYDAHVDISSMLLLLPVLYVGCGLAAISTTALIKYLLIGTYKPTVQPLWSHFVWRSELVTTLYENFPVPLLLDHLRGTPFINMCLRLMGSKIGKRVYTDTADITEHDAVSIGDDASLNDNCGLQTHLFEERIMKVSNVNIGARCTVGAASIVLYDAVMEDDSQLGDLSMLMKGETLPEKTEWEGLPAQRVL